MGLPTGVAGVTGVDGINTTDIGDPASTLQLARGFARQVQVVAFAAAVNIDPSKGEIIVLGTITSSFTIALTGNYILLGELTFIFLHDATANVYAITWPANFKKNFALTNTANSRDNVTFVSDGATWYQVRHEGNIA